MTTDVRCKIIHIAVNETPNGISHDGLAIEWDLIRSAQGKIQAARMVAQQGEKVIRCRIGQAVCGDKLMQLFVELQNRGRIH
jgi:hypothetical protein